MGITAARVGEWHDLTDITPKSSASKTGQRIVKKVGNIINSGDQANSVYTKKAARSSHNVIFGSIKDLERQARTRPVDYGKADYNKPRSTPRKTTVKSGFLSKAKNRKGK